MYAFSAEHLVGHAVKSAEPNSSLHSLTTRYDRSYRAFTVSFTMEPQLASSFHDGKYTVMQCYHLQSSRPKLLFQEHYQIPASISYIHPSVCVYYVCIYKFLFLIWDVLNIISNHMDNTVKLINTGDLVEHQMEKLKISIFYCGTKQQTTPGWLLGSYKVEVWRRWWHFRGLIRYT